MISIHIHVLSRGQREVFNRHPGDENNLFYNITLAATGVVHSAPKYPPESQSSVSRLEGLSVRAVTGPICAMTTTL